MTGEGQHEREMRAEQVGRLVRQVLGEEPRQVTHQDFGHRSLTFDVRLPERSVIVRTNADGRVFAGTVQNIVLLRDLGLPVPRVLAADLTRDHVPFAYLILDKIPGRDLRDELAVLTEPQMTRLAAQLVEFQKRVAGLSLGTGFGYVPIGERGPQPSWWDVIRPGPPDETDPWEVRIFQAMMRHESYFRQVPPTCFLDDITVKNVIIQDGALQGLVDFDVVCYGDSLYWLGLTATVVVCDVGLRELFYVDELCRLFGVTPAQRPVFALYAAGITHQFLRRFAPQETEAWCQRMQQALEQWWSEADAAPRSPPQT